MPAFAGMTPVALLASPIQFSNSGRASSPLFFTARGRRPSCPFPRRHAEGMERRVAPHLGPHLFGASVLGEGRCAPRRSTQTSLRRPGLFAAISVPGTGTSGRAREPPGSLHPGAFATLHVRRVQPLKAAPRSWGGRLPGASRRQGYEPRPQAPPLPHVQRASAERPSLGEGDGIICLGFLTCQETLSLFADCRRSRSSSRASTPRTRRSVPR
jgi:hypothetical protein